MKQGEVQIKANKESNGRQLPTHLPTEHLEPLSLRQVTKLFMDCLISTTMSKGSLDTQLDLRHPSGHQ